MEREPGHGRPFESIAEIKAAAERCELVTVGCVIVRREWQMSYSGRISTVKTLHGCLQRQLGEVVRIENEITKALAQFGDSDPLVTRLREQLRRAESQLGLAQTAYLKAQGEL